MKKIILESAYQPFLLLGLIALSISIFFKGLHPDSFFDVSIFNMDFSIATSRIWFLFTGYIFFLVLIYYIISRTTLRSKQWMIISHYIFILLFLIFFSIFLSFGNTSVQSLMTKIPFSTLISIYGIILITDVSLFIFGVLFLLLNLISLRKNKSK